MVVAHPHKKCSVIYLIYQRRIKQTLHHMYCIWQPPAAERSVVMETKKKMKCFRSIFMSWNNRFTAGKHKQKHKIKIETERRHWRQCSVSQNQIIVLLRVNCCFSLFVFLSFSFVLCVSFVTCRVRIAHMSMLCALCSVCYPMSVCLFVCVKWG